MVCPYHAIAWYIAAAGEALNHGWVPNRSSYSYARPAILHSAVLACDLVSGLFFIHFLLFLVWVVSVSGSVTPAGSRYS